MLPGGWDLAACCTPPVLVSCVGMCPIIAARMPGLGGSHLGSIRCYATVWEERSAVKISQVRSVGS